MYNTCVLPKPITTCQVETEFRKRLFLSFVSFSFPKGEKTLFVNRRSKLFKDIGLKYKNYQVAYTIHIYEVESIYIIPNACKNRAYEVQYL